MMKKKAPGKAAVKGKAAARPAPPAPAALFDRVAHILDEARSHVVRAVNTQMVLAYWLIGREIVQELQGGEERAAYGKQVLRELSRRLTERYGRGFSVTNLKNFRKFYTVYHQRVPEFQQIYHIGCGELPPFSEEPIRQTPSGELVAMIQQPLEAPALTTPEVLNDMLLAAKSGTQVLGFSAQLSWSHYQELMQVEHPSERRFYEIEAEKCGWDVRHLERQIHTFLFARLLKSRDKAGVLALAVKGQAVVQPIDAIKNPYVLDFLALPESTLLREAEVEAAIISNLQAFLLELGKGFAFVARQKRIDFNGEFFYIDLVFYHCILKCYVLIDLKLGKLTHQDVGQMDSYVRMFDDLCLAEGDNPTIGLILCADQSGAMARYSVLKEVLESSGFANEKLAIPPARILENLQKVQGRHDLPISPELKKTAVCDLNLDTEMETGTGKTYCYIKTMFELNQAYGWSKFIIVVPSIAIREGVAKSFEIMAEHFLADYGKRIRSFIYHSKQLHNLESFSSDAGINVMIINVQAFNARGEDARRIYLELDDFQSRRPIDVIAKNRPILILDEPQKMEGRATVKKLADFKPLMILRYSATHKTEHNKIYRLDALDAYNQKLVKKIAVRGISVKGLAGTNSYLFLKGIDEVAKYRSYQDTGEAGEQAGEYARIFEEEYNLQVNDILTLENTPYKQYLKGITAKATHNGYFSIDKKTKRMVNPDAKKTGESAGETDDVDAYDLILKDKERLLTFAEPVRFLFSHSALREGWDNSNVFVICTLKHSDNQVARRQEVGRGMRLCRDQSGDRIDDPAIVHNINVLTVVANESYRDFVDGLQKEIGSSLSSRPQKANKEYFANKILKTEQGDVMVSPKMATQIEFYLIQQGYVDVEHRITEAYHTAVREGTLAPLPPELAPYQEQVLQLVSTVFSAGQLPEIDDELKTKENPLNANFEKKEFQELWNRINRKAVFAVEFATDELVAKCIKTLDLELKVTPLQYTVTAGEQKAEASFDAVKRGDSFEGKSNRTENLTSTAGSNVKYDLIGKLCEGTKLTRRTMARILQGITPPRFAQYRTNPENFIMEAARLINEQKATVIIEHLTYDTTEDRHGMEIFTQTKKEDLGKGLKANRHIYDYVFTDSGTERTFAGELDASAEVVVYAKLPKSFTIPTPVGNYTPDWAIAFQAGTVKHVYFVAETKGDITTMQLKKIEAAKIDCARKFFGKISDNQVRYDFLKTYGQLMELVK